MEKEKDVKTDDVAANLSTMQLALKTKDAQTRQAEAEAELAMARKQLAEAEAEKKKMIEAVLKNDPTMKMKISGEDNSIEQLRTKLKMSQKTNMSNLEYAKVALELREKVMANGGTDPFLAQGPRIAKQAIDTNFVAEKMKDIIDASYDDPNVFNGNMKTALQDTPNVDKMMKGRIKGLNY